jgi:triacylglycerol lipase
MHLYLSPGFFGFTRLAHYDYFAHVQRALTERFQRAGQEAEIHISDVGPTASVRRRATKLAELIHRTAGDKGSIHLLGHSTGGLDARLVASPCTQLGAALDLQRWQPRLRSVTMMNTPHFGTPLATFFATTRGQQALYLLSAFTVVGLALGSRPLGLASALLRLFGQGDQVLGFELPILNRSVDTVLGLVDDVRGEEIRAFLRAVQSDQGAVIQLSPEAMDLMAAGFPDRDGVVYQSTVSMSPAPSLKNWFTTVGHPLQATSLGLFTALHHITAQVDHRYPCSPEKAALEAADHQLRSAFGERPTLHSNDGIVPVHSQLWGKTIWAGFGDHLDVLGHYRDKTPENDRSLRHHDWLTSGSRFDDAHFESLMDAIATGILAAGH